MKNLMRKGTAIVPTALALLLTACGGGGDSPQAPTSVPTAVTPPPETLFVESNAWNEAIPANAETVTPEEFRRRQTAGELQVVTPAAQQAQQEAQRTTRQTSIATERAFLESKTDLSDDELALLAEANTASGIDGDSVTTLPSGQQIALIDLGTRIEKAAQDYRLARDPANALATYQLSYSLLADALKAQVPAPTTLSGSTLEQIQQAAQQLNAVLATVPDLDNVRLDPEAPPTSMNPVSNDRKSALNMKRALGTGPGNGTDNSGVCTATGIVSRYWFPLRNFVSPVKNQARRGTCWAFAAIGVIESRERVQNNNAADLSEQFLVNKHKREWFPSDLDDGGSGAAALNAAFIRKQALLPEAGWTYNPALGRPINAFDAGVVGTKASYKGTCDNYSGWCWPDAHQSNRVCTTVLSKQYCAATNMVYNGGGVMASHVDLLWEHGQPFNLDSYRALLSNGVSLIATFPIYVGFQDVTTTGATAGIVSDYRVKQRLMPSGTIVDGTAGSHLVQVVGFISNEQLSFPGAAPSDVGGGGYFIIRNSWGCNVGDGGYYYVPAKYVSDLFSSLEVPDFDTFRSARWKDEQAVPGGSAGLAIDPQGMKSVDLRVQANLASGFTVSHPVANYVHLKVTSNLDGTLFDGQWLTNMPMGGSLFANSLPVNFQTQGVRTLTLTARYGSQVVTATKEIRVMNSEPVITFQSSGVPQQGENFVINAIVADRNEANPASICNAMIWSVTAPDVIVSGEGCTRVIKFGVTGVRNVRASSQDREGLAGSVINAFDVAPPPANPYPRITAFNAYSRDVQRIGGAIVGCQSNAIINTATIDLRQIGCKLQGINVPDRPRYFAQIGIDNPTAEVLSYDWTYTVYSGNPIIPTVLISTRTTTPSYDMSAPVFGALDTPYSCTVDVKVNAPEASRSKSLRVWSGQCINVQSGPR